MSFSSNSLLYISYGLYTAELAAASAILFTSAELGRQFVEAGSPGTLPCWADLIKDAASSLRIAAGARIVLAYFNHRTDSLAHWAAASLAMTLGPVVQLALLAHHEISCPKQIATQSESLAPNVLSALSRVNWTGIILLWAMLALGVADLVWHGVLWNKFRGSKSYSELLVLAPALYKVVDALTPLLFDQKDPNQAARASFFRKGLNGFWYLWVGWTGYAFLSVVFRFFKTSAGKEDAQLPVIETHAISDVTEKKSDLKDSL